MGEVIPSLHAWMPPEAMRERVNYHEEVTKDLAQKKSKNRAQKKGQKRPSYPGVQSDQSHDTYLEAKAPREQMKTTQELLEEYGEDLIEANVKGRAAPPVDTQSTPQRRSGIPALCVAGNQLPNQAT